MRTRRHALSVLALLILPAAASAVTFDLATDWSDASNPNGAWFYNEGPVALPHVDWWQRVTGGWSTAQPAWANSEDGADRVPAFFKSVGTETFTHDWLAGDVVVRTGDSPNGDTPGPARLTWCSPECGNVSVNGGIWMGRDLGRSVYWTMWVNGAFVSDGTVHTGDAYNRGNPYLWSNGSGGSGAVQNIAVFAGTLITFVFVPTADSDSGEFAGLNVSIDLTMCTSAEPTTWGGIKAIYRN